MRRILGVTLAVMLASVTQAQGQRIVLPSLQIASVLEINCHPSRQSVLQRSLGEEPDGEDAQAYQIRLAARAQAELRKAFVVQFNHPRSPRHELGRRYALAKNYRRYLERQARIWLTSEPIGLREIPEYERRRRIANTIERQIAQYVGVRYDSAI